MFDDIIFIKNVKNKIKTIINLTKNKEINMEERNRIEEEKYNENKNKEFELLYKMMAEHAMVEKNLQELLEYIEIKEAELPNVSITINNKLVELYNRWEETGNKRDSFLLAIAINNLMITMKAAIGEMQKIQTVLKSKIYEEESQSLQKTSFLNRFIGKIKSFFGSKKQDNLYLKKEEKETIEQCIENFKQYDKEIYDYNLENNVLDNLYEEFDKSEWSDVADRNNAIEYIAYDLRQLGLKDASVKLKKRYQQEDSKKEWKTSLQVETNPEIQNENMEKNYPEFNNETKENPESSVDVVK